MDDKTITLNGRKYVLRNDKRAEFRRTSRADEFRKADGFAIICLHVWAMVDLPTKRLPEPEDIAAMWPEDEDESSALANDVLYILTDGKMGGADDVEPDQAKQAKKKRSKSGHSSESQLVLQETNI